MPRRSSVAQLPQEVRRWLERSLEENGFGQYELLADLLREKGHTISKSALHSWGQGIERQRAEIKGQTEAARQLTDGSPDDRDSRTEAVLALLQTGLIQGLRTLQDTQAEADPEARVLLLSKVGKDSASMAQASIALKKHQAARDDFVRKQLLDEQRAKLDAMGNKHGVTEETKLAIREALGIS